MKLPKVLIGSVGNDVHTVAIRLLQIELEQQGCSTVFLGVNRLPEEFVENAKKETADVVLISSLNGEAEVWCRSIPEKMAAAGLGHVDIILGGNLKIGDYNDSELESFYLSLGYKRVYSRRGNPRKIVDEIISEWKS